MEGIKTVRDLVAIVGYNKPFVFRFQYDRIDRHAVFFQDGETLFVAETTNTYPGYYELKRVSSLDTSYLVRLDLIDWFENTTLPEYKITYGPPKTVCSCDFQTVLLRYGCQCGGV